ncbi:MAG: hypothetical protein ACOZCL_10365 [Bacillota bacterium]
MYIDKEKLLMLRALMLVIIIAAYIYVSTAYGLTLNLERHKWR